MMSHLRYVFVSRRWGNCCWVCFFGSNPLCPERYTVRNSLTRRRRPLILADRFSARIWGVYLVALFDEIIGIGMKPEQACDSYLRIYGNKSFNRRMRRLLIAVPVASRPGVITGAVKWCGPCQYFWRVSSNACKGCARFSASTVAVVTSGLQ
jgi:hypothetical protein